MNRRVVDLQEFSVTSLALSGMGGGGRAEPEERSKAGGYRQGDAIGIVDSNALQMLALTEAVHEALQALVRQRPVKLRLDTFLQAFAENFGAAGEIVAQDAALGADLVASEKQGHHNDADNKRRDKLQCRAHEYFPLGQERRFRFRIRKGDANPRGEKRDIYRDDGR